MQCKIPSGGGELPLGQLDTSFMTNYHHHSSIKSLATAPGGGEVEPKVEPTRDYRGPIHHVDEQLRQRVQGRVRAPRGSISRPKVKPEQQLLTFVHDVGTALGSAILQPALPLTTMTQR